MLKKVINYYTISAASGKKLIVSIYLLLCVGSLYANTDKDKYVNVLVLTKIGQHESVQHDYHRLDTVNHQYLRKPVKSLLTNSAGIAFLFKTNSVYIKAKWEVAPHTTGANMSALLHSGLDLYIKKEGHWMYAGSGLPSGAKSTRTLVSDMEDGEKECMLYLPTYNELKKLEIGVSDNSFIERLENPFDMKILVYGSSITQGASASRPGMAYLARLSRKLNIEFVNLGLSGNGLIESEMVDVISSMPADAYILDCGSNPSAKQIRERMGYMVKTIREKNPAKPIIMVQGIKRDGGIFNQTIKQNAANQRTAFEEEYIKLCTQGVEHLYYINSSSFLGNDGEGTVDGTHPNDLGFSRMCEILEKELKKILTTTTY